MAHIKIKKGLNIPIAGSPEGDIKPLVLSGTASHSTKPQFISLNLKAYEHQSFRLHAKVDDFVKIGDPIAEDKDVEGRMFVAPASGTIREIRRGLKRRLLDIVIEVSDNEEFTDLGSLDISSSSREVIIAKLLKGGLFHRIRQRPFDLLADPKKTPKAIFVKALESAPFTPSPEMQVKGYEKQFQAGLDALAKLTDGKVHLVYRSGTDFLPFTNAQNVDTHTAEGPHPVSNHSVHIQKICPITKIDDTIWTLNAYDVVCMGHLLTTGRYFIDRVVSIAGSSILKDKRGFFKVREGFPISSLISGRVEKSPPSRFISGDPLMGMKVESDEFLGMSHFVFCAIPEPTKRELLHFFRLGTDKYSFSGAYLSGHFNNKTRTYDFTTNQHGEHRPFIDSQLYKKVMPLDIPTMLLCKAVMAEDYDLAEELGLLEVSGEDFALTSFVDPSKVEMTDIINNGLKRYSEEMLALSLIHISELLA